MSPCEHNSSCVPITPSTYLCQCPPRYTGHNCESYIPLCDSGPCQNNATCVDSEQTQTFHCKCDEGFVGTFCETDVDYCADNNCTNDSVCTDGKTAYTCECVLGTFHNILLFPPPFKYIYVRISLGLNINAKSIHGESASHFTQVTQDSFVRLILTNVDPSHARMKLSVRTISTGFSASVQMVSSHQLSLSLYLSLLITSFYLPDMLLLY